jgi:hypothetical protein
MSLSKTQMRNLSHKTKKQRAGRIMTTIITIKRMSLNVMMKAGQRVC